MDHASILDAEGTATPSPSPSPSPSTTTASTQRSGGRLARLFLTADPHQRLRIVRSLWSAVIIAISVGMMAYGVRAGLVDAGAGRALSCAMLTSSVIFYLALRTGFNLRFDDPALTLPQVIAALTWIAGAYGATQEAHGGTLMFVALVLVFGAFNLTPRRARLSSWYAVLVMGLMMAFKCTRDAARFQPQVECAYFIFLATMVPTVAVLAAHLDRMRQHLHEQKTGLITALARIEDMASRDPLTGLINRRKMMDVLADHAALGKRKMLSFSVAYIDLDHFKRVNDDWGHGVGDEVLRGFAAEASLLLRETDVISRWGGEEFLVLLPDLPSGSPVVAIERLRSALASRQLSQTAPALRMTFSSGLAAHRWGEPIEKTIDRADKALYQAKVSGRDRSVMAGDTAPG